MSPLLHALVVLFLIANPSFLRDLVWQLEFGGNNVFFVYSSGCAAEWWNNIWD